MKIFVIFTGGTIGSRVKDGWISTDRETKFELIEGFKATDKRNIEFVCIQPYFVLSENLSAKELNLLFSAYKEAEDSDADGIIVTHGTDSIQFSAAALSLVSKNCKPTLMVSANYPLDDPRGNGWDNFSAAVDFIEQNCGRGVFVSYKNPDGGHYFHAGHRVVSFLEGDDRLYSMNHTPYAEYVDGEISILDKTAPIKRVSPCPLTEDSGILCISALPGDRFGYSLDGVRAVIIRPYHSGTVATENLSFADFCRRAQSLDIPIFLVNAPKSTTYDSAKLFRELNIIPLPNTTFSEAYMRIWFGISGGENPKNLF